MHDVDAGARGQAVVTLALVSQIDTDEAARVVADQPRRAAVRIDERVSRRATTVLVGVGDATYPEYGQREEDDC